VYSLCSNFSSSRTNPTTGTTAVLHRWSRKPAGRVRSTKARCCCCAEGCSCCSCAGGCCCSGCCCSCAGACCSCAGCAPANHAGHGRMRLSVVGRHADRRSSGSLGRTYDGPSPASDSCTDSCGASCKSCRTAGSLAGGMGVRQKSRNSCDAQS
jgi:hypothetical protein